MDNNLERFIMAQNKDYYRALNEIKNGYKSSHWIWYIFPQIDGITKYPSSMNKFYSIKSIEEAIAYYNNSILRNRLLEITDALLNNNKPIKDIVGEIDAKKICSCMTLFAHIDIEETRFQSVIYKFYNGHWDTRTLDIMTDMVAEENG